MPAFSPCIVVGYDGLQTALAAVELAARRAAPNGEVIVVNAYPLPADWFRWPAYGDILKIPAREGRALLDGVADAVPSLCEVAWQSELVSGRPASAIESVAAVRDADEIIVGTRGFSAARALLGSTAHELLHTAGRPVTAVPARAVPDSEPANERAALEEVSR